MVVPVDTSPTAPSRDALGSLNQRLADRGRTMLSFLSQKLMSQSLSELCSVRPPQQQGVYGGGGEKHECAPAQPESCERERAAGISKGKKSVITLEQQAEQRLSRRCVARSEAAPTHWTADDSEQHSSEDELYSIVGGAATGVFAGSGQCNSGSSCSDLGECCDQRLHRHADEADASDEEVRRLFFEIPAQSPDAGRHIGGAEGGSCCTALPPLPPPPAGDAVSRRGLPAIAARHRIRSSSLSPAKHCQAGRRAGARSPSCSDEGPGRPRLNFEKMHQKATGHKRHYPRVIGIKSCNSSPKAKITCLVSPLDFRSISSVQHRYSPAVQIERPSACSF